MTFERVGSLDDLIVDEEYEYNNSIYIDHPWNGRKCKFKGVDNSGHIFILFHNIEVSKTISRAQNLVRYQLPYDPNQQKDEDDDI